jgi:2-oxo-4-hydroxy-4-carboxy-5-ureidoimidazoline decarboxylase
MTLEQLNGLDREAAEEVFLRCCGSTRWAREMAARRPFRDAAIMAREAESLSSELKATDWLEAFAAHPRIGESQRAGRAGRAGGAGESGQDWSAREQAGVDAAPDAVRQRLAAANRDYEARFGFLYIVCATGKTANQMLDIAERRLTHSPDEELHIAAGEQLKITRLRLAKLIS